LYGSCSEEEIEICIEISHRHGEKLRLNIETMAAWRQNGAIWRYGCRKHQRRASAKISSGGNNQRSGVAWQNMRALCENEGQWLAKEVMRNKTNEKRRMARHGEKWLKLINRRRRYSACIVSVSSWRRQ